MSTLQFQHDRKIGEHFLEIFDGGARLFPPDPLADVATEILSSREIPKDLVEAVLASYNGEKTGLRSQDFAEIHRELSLLVTQVDYRRILMDQHVATLLDDHAWVEKMLSDVKANWRAVRRVPID